MCHLFDWSCLASPIRASASSAVAVLVRSSFACIAISGLESLRRRSAIRQAACDWLRQDFEIWMSCRPPTDSRELHYAPSRFVKQRGYNGDPQTEHTIDSVLIDFRCGKPRWRSIWAAIDPTGRHRSVVEKSRLTDFLPLPLSAPRPVLSII